MRTRLSERLRSLVREREFNCCAYCRSPERLSVASFEIDHIIPLSAGGKTQPDNLCLACPTCNRYKSDRLTALDPQSGDVVPLFHPREESWHDHFAWDTDRVTLVGLTPTGRATIHALDLNRERILKLRRLWAKLGVAPWAEQDSLGKTGE